MRIFGFIGLLGLAVGMFLVHWLPSHTGPPNETYDAVLLDNGQVYYGKLSEQGSEYVVLREMYYIQQAKSGQDAVLVRRGNEWHAPTSARINRSHIVLIEPVSPKSKLAELIAQEHAGK